MLAHYVCLCSERPYYLGLGQVAQASEVIREDCLVSYWETIAAVAAGMGVGTIVERSLVGVGLDN